jgi:hypothetical protein
MSKTFKIAGLTFFLMGQLVAFGQSYINSVLGRYSVSIIRLQGTTPMDTCIPAILDLAPDQFYSNCVFQMDSCFATQTIDGQPWDILVNSDSTFVGYAPWTAANAATGKLYANDSIYLKVHIFATAGGNGWKEFRGFKLYSTVGVEKLNLAENEILLSPQPANDIIYLQSTQVLFTETDLLFMYDINGKKVNSPVHFVNNRTYKIDVRTLDPGMYFIVVETSKGKSRKKVLIQ